MPRYRLRVWELLEDPGWRVICRACPEGYRYAGTLLVVPELLGVAGAEALRYTAMDRVQISWQIPESANRG